MDGDKAGLVAVKPGVGSNRGNYQARVDFHGFSYMISFDHFVFLLSLSDVKIPIFKKSFRFMGPGELVNRYQIQILTYAYLCVVLYFERNGTGSCQGKLCRKGNDLRSLRIQS